MQEYVEAVLERARTDKPEGAMVEEKLRVRTVLMDATVTAPLVP